MGPVGDFLETDLTCDLTDQTDHSFFQKSTNRWEKNDL